MQSFEIDFADGLAKLDHDSRSCANSAYTGLTFHRLAFVNSSLWDAIQANAGFWNNVLAGLQASAFVAMGRIYDDRRGTQNASALLKLVADYPGLFVPSSLEARKIREGVAADAAREYVKTAFNFPKDGAAHLVKAFEEHTQVYCEKVEPIRHKVFAHSAKLNRSDIDRLFGQVPIRDFERLSVFPLRLHRALWHLWVNGIEPVLDNAPTETQEVIERIPPKGTNTWEHLHAAGDAKVFLDWLGDHANDVHAL